MLCRAMVFVLAVSFAATAACAAERAAAPAVQPEPDGSLASGWAMSGDTAPGVAVGDPAPAFSYLGIDGDWHRSHDLIVGGPVLLVFGAGEAQLVELEQQLGAFHELGVQPVAVLDMRTGSA